MALNKGIFEWDVIVEKSCNYIWVGICSSENFNYKSWAGGQSTGWVLGSNGECCKIISRNYCPPFGDGTKITIHLDMNKRTCAFTVNGTKYPEVSGWNNLPSKLYPVVSLRFPDAHGKENRGYMFFEFNSFILDIDETPPAPPLLPEPGEEWLPI
ncbi:hypothetical protein RhiirA1_468412 [Rhizophagus irregularis]|uniref:B30.2/SPRY domain-containing protein n=1 Tax=Rhizophagus irregularis TaxID=588596 RepID=A0A2N0RA42_9GLOM|nr:hypothetical protein RhiirA1_468412 [Rhizophagus irregularis]